MNRGSLVRRVKGNNVSFQKKVLFFFASIVSLQKLYKSCMCGGSFADVIMDFELFEVMLREGHAFRSISFMYTL